MQYIFLNLSVSKIVPLFAIFNCTGLSNLFEICSFSCLDITTLNVQTGGEMTAAGKDRPNIIKANSPVVDCNSGGGGGYASEGGIHGQSSTSAKPYGNLYFPRAFGTNGCGGGSINGNAGGLFFLTIASNLHLDGNLTVHGQNGGSYTSGGGSGGSILIETLQFTGNGVLDVSGGNAKYHESGGGSGGRLALYIKSKSRFFGEYLALGGTAGNLMNDLSRASGGPGTVYINEFINQMPYNRLVIDNKNRPFSHYVTLNESISLYEFNEVQLKRKASLHIVKDGKQSNFTIHKILGDGTGLIHMHENQVLTAEVQDARRTITRAQTNFKLDVGSSAIMSTVVHMIGKGEVAFHWQGRLINVMNLHLAYKRKAFIGIEAHTGTIENNKFVSSETEGTFHFTTLEFGSKSLVDYPSPHGMHFTVGFLVCVYY